MVHGEVKRGTKIIFELKEEQSEFLAERRLKDLAKKLSGFIGFSHRVARGKIEGERSDRFGENEDDNRGGR